MGVGESKNIKKEICILGHGTPTTKREIDELYTNESSMCKIVFQDIEDGKTLNKSGTGFFCEIDDDNIPFKKALFTNNHVLNENRIHINNEFKFYYLKKLKIIKITEERKRFTNKDLEYTCIEIFDSDKINNFFKIDKEIFNNKKNIIDKEIFILQYANGGELAHGLGTIGDINDNIIFHSVATSGGSSGSPLIKRYNINLVLGIHFGGEVAKSNYATPFDIIIKDIIDKVSYNKKNIINNNNSIEYINKINLIYYKKYNEEEDNKIFGEKFVENNKDNITLIINGDQNKLVSKYTLKEGENNIQMIIKKPLTNIEYIFYSCKSLNNIEGLEYLNTEKINNFSYMFCRCSSLSDIKGLKNWNVSNGNNFSGMFLGCSSLSNIEALENWNVSNGNNFSGMFSGCLSLEDIKGLQNWKVLNGNNFSFMFHECSSLSDIKELKNWNVSKGNDFCSMFYECSSLLDIKALENWNVTNGNNFSFMFYECTSLSDIKALENWNVSNGNNFSRMFLGCSSLLNIKGIEKWEVSNGNNFALMFWGCSSLSNIITLRNWNVSNGYNFSYMFSWCSSLSDIKGLENWNVSNGNNFKSMFEGCKSLSDINALQNWNVSNGNNFSKMFEFCRLALGLQSLQNWNVSKGANCHHMFKYICNKSKILKAIHNWNVYKEDMFN